MLHERIVALEEALIRLQYEGALDDRKGGCWRFRGRSRPCGRLLGDRRAVTLAIQKESITFAYTRTEA